MATEPNNHKGHRFGERQYPAAGPTRAQRKRAKAAEGSNSRKSQHQGKV